MKQWLVDAIDQIALGEVLAESGLSCGERFGLISIDNSIEFMLIAYIEVFKRLVGGYKVGGIPNNNWEKKKRNFSDLLSLVVSKEPSLSKFEDEINRYHDLRNDLYHTGKPRTVSKSKIYSYSKLAREVLSSLFCISYDQDEWKEILERTRESLSGISESTLPKRSVTFEISDNKVRYITQANPTAKEAICLIIHGFSIRHGRQPAHEELIPSLALSGYSITKEVLNSRLYELRKDKIVRKQSLALTVKGKNVLIRDYIFP